MPDPPDLPRTIEREIHEHEVFLSFTNDEDAYNFYDWWADEGEHLFNKWERTL